KALATNGTFQLAVDRGDILTSKTVITAPTVSLSTTGGFNKIDVATQTNNLTTSSTASTKVSNSGELTLAPATAGGSYVLRQTHTGGRFDSAKITLNGSITVSGGSSSIQIDVERQHPDHSTGIAVGVAGVVLTAVSVDLNIHGEGSIGSA